MGSEKFPIENDFDHFCSSHSGYDNAYTEAEHTLFHFDIIEKHLSNALDRFSNLFIAPLMSLPSMQREIAAVESEFQNNISDDDVRTAQIYASMIYNHHPSSNFIWGNSKTLRDDIDSQTLHKQMHAYRRKHYTANRMFLCVQSSIEISRIERSIVTQFSGIPSGKCEKSNSAIKDPFDIFKPDFYEKLFFVKSTSEKCKLLMTFAFPPLEGELKFLEYLASLIEFEGPGSLSDFFMDDSLALKVKARVGRQNFEGNSFFTLFTIDINLTSKGHHNFDTVLSAIFSFLLLLKSTKMEDHESRYREFKEIKETLFKYRKEMTAIENVQEIAVNMKYFADKDVVVGSYYCPAFDPAAVRGLIDRLNENKFNVLVLSDKYCKPHNMRERWFGTEYSAIDFPYKRLWNERWLMSELHLPRVNEFICRNFGIFNNPCEQEERHPRKIFENELCECYYKMDKKYELPYGYVYVYFISPLTQASVENLNMTSIYSMCVKNFLSEKLYPAIQAGFSYKLNSVETGLILRLSGFNEKLPLIVDIITQEMKTTISKNVFENFKKELRKNCFNCLMDLNILNE
jgi:nardilysin